MITIDGVTYRNLQEQVLANQKNIQRIVDSSEVLAELGIKIVGQEDTPELLPDPLTYAGDFGDAYLVGAKEPYDYYLFTRPFEGEEYPKWFNIGQFPAPGPQGPQGPQGLQGPQGNDGTKITYSKGYPTNVPPKRQGDMVIDTETGWLYIRTGNSFERLVNIIGPQGVKGDKGNKGDQGIQGPQGIQGIQGPVGKTITVKGTLNSIQELPNPNAVGRESAYLVKTTGDNKDIYGIVGDDILSWENFGKFGDGTDITVNGVFQNTFEMNTKMDMPTTELKSQAAITVSPGQKADYTDLVWRPTDTVNTGIPMMIDGLLMVDTDKIGMTGNPDPRHEVISKGYADNHYEKNLRQYAIPFLIRATDADGKPFNLKYSDKSASIPGTLAQRTTSGAIYTATPTADFHAATKKYVDEHSGGGGSGAEYYTETKEQMGPGGLAASIFYGKNFKTIKGRLNITNAETLHISGISSTIPLVDNGQDIYIDLIYEPELGGYFGNITYANMTTSAILKYPHPEIDINIQSNLGTVVVFSGYVSK